MVKSIVLNPKKIQLDLENPRFSLFQFLNEEEIIDYLVEFEDIKSLALQMIKNGYLTLGERIIILEKNQNGKKQHIVLEGNRRVAALKIIFNQKYRFSSADKEKIAALDINDFMVDCDVVDENEKDDALFKITTKHINGIKEWKATDKRVFYVNLFNQYKKNGLNSDEAIVEIEKITPDSKAKIKNAIRQHQFLSMIHEQVKISYPSIEELSHLDNDVLTSRVLLRLKPDLNLTESQDYFLVCKEDKKELFDLILKSLGEAAWISGKLNTRTFNTKNMWEELLDDDKIIPGLKNLMESYITLETNQEVSRDEGTEMASTTTEENEKNNTEKPTTNKKDVDQQPTSNNENHDKIENRLVKYRLFIKESSIAVYKPGYRLFDNVEILDEQGNSVPRSSFIYSEIVFVSDNHNIVIKENKVLPISENGKYTVKVTLLGVVKTFSLLLNVPVKKSIDIDEKHLFSEKWYEEAVALISSKEELSNIVSVLNCLNGNKNIHKNSDNFVVIAFLIRILVEYSSKAYWNKYREKSARPKELPSLVSQIATHLFNQKIISKEEKKSFANGNDLETLNGQIHDYKSNISSITIESIFKSYQNYLDKLFMELHK